MATTTFYPDLLYRDAEAAMRWLEDALGFARREDHRDGDGNVIHAELALEGAVVMIASGGVGREPFRSLTTGESLVYCATDAVDALYERAKRAGADIALELTETDYVSRDFSVSDTEGNEWAFCTYRPGA